jgi:hypothetical protein
MQETQYMSDEMLSPENLDLEPDPIADSCVTAAPSDVVVLIGFLGSGQSDEHRRLFRDHTFRRWVEIPAADIKNRFLIGGHGQPMRSIVWVDVDANVVECESVAASSYAPQSRGMTGGGEEDLAYKVPR